ncbi:basic salivary proline-rich protein 3-like [Gymnogyps californianus]|uniref:basic salivary proline-rich protein 3-like n=1 Tax=Gymnogyps californianus TaxID=33616 RepID=UPI0021C8D555|nr:basic salivary proline-rich protein 3-like [Gymnogyps californianus]
MISRDLSLRSQQRNRVSVSVSLPAETTASTPTPRAVSTLLCSSGKAAQARHLRKAVACPAPALPRIGPRRCHAHSGRRRLHPAALPGDSSHERGRPERPVSTSSQAAPLPPLSAGSGAPEGRTHTRTPPQQPPPPRPAHTHTHGSRSEGAPAEPEEQSERCPARRRQRPAADGERRVKRSGLQARVALPLAHRPQPGMGHDERGCPGAMGGLRAASGKGPPRGRGRHPPRRPRLASPHPPSAAAALSHPLLPPRLATPSPPPPGSQSAAGPAPARPIVAAPAGGGTSSALRKAAARRPTRQPLGPEETGEIAPPASPTVTAGSRDRPPLQ